MQPLTIKLVLFGTIPSKKNNKVARVNSSGSAYITSAFNYKKWLKNKGNPQFIELKRKLRMKHPGLQLPISDQVKFHVIFYFGDIRKRDLINKMETLQDLLQHHGFILDDSYYILNPISAAGKYQRGLYRTEIYLTGPIL